METIRKRFLREHEGLRRSLEELGNAVEGADPATITNVWTDFERTLERHLETEETLILPALASRHPDEVRRIRGEHAKIRALVAELGVSADLHTLRKDVADALIAALEAHAKREDQGIYLWAEREVGGLGARLFEQAGSVV